MLPRLLAVAAATSLLAAPQAGAAATAPQIDTTPGLALAERWCAECHAVHAADRLSPNVAAPHFAEVAASPDATELSLHVFLQSEHEMMPPLRLSSEQADQLIDYILSLKNAP
jgi:mono/diheme cytochrome c family protein